MENFQSEDFIGKYSERVKGTLFDLRLDSFRIKINRILQKENLHFDDEGYLVLQSENKESETRICNFFILPTHSLYFDDGDKLLEAGIAVELYSQFSDEKYKRILVNLSDDVIEKGNWQTTTFVDRDFLVYKPEFLHRYLRIAIKLSSRIIKEKAKKVFYDDVWLEDDEALEHIDEYRRARRMLPLMKFGSGDENEANQKEDTDAVHFLRAQSHYIASIRLLPFPDEHPIDVKEWGWEDNDYYYLIYKNTWSWIRAHFNRNGIKLNTKDKELDDYLIEIGVFESNENRSNSVLRRADRNVPQIKPRAFMINKVRFNEFLLHKGNER